MLIRYVRASAVLLFVAACSSSESDVGDGAGDVDDRDATSQADGSATSEDASDTADASLADGSDASDASDAEDASDGEDAGDAGVECTNGASLACYGGPGGTAGVGLCKAGLRVCKSGVWEACTGEVQPALETCDGLDNDCDGVIDNGVKNACGGCSVLASAPGAACESCGTVACDGTEAVVCVPPPSLGTACTTPSNAPGTMVCAAEGAVVCTANRVLISEVCGGNGSGNGATDEFVELYNPMSFEISLAGWVLQYASATGTSYGGSYTFPANVKIRPKGYYLIAGANYSGAVARDAEYGFDMSASITGGGHVRIGYPGLGTNKADESKTVDKVGYGTANSPEGAAAPSHPAAGGSFERKAVSSSTSATMAAGGADALRGNGYDSDDNSKDFVSRATRDPQNSSSTTESP